MAVPGAFAAELGDISALSHVGQPLSADIELTALAPEEGNGMAVRLASIDVYQGGGITMDPALQGLVISQVVRDGRRYVHVTTQQAITAGHVHLYFVLGSGGGANVRLATVWLTPAPLAPVSVPAPAPAPLAVLPVLPARPTAPPPDAAALAARARAEGMVRPPAVFVPPAVPLMRSPLRRAVTPAASCAPQVAATPDASCVALNQQNAALNDKLGELEGKVGALQKALAVPAVAPAPALAPASVPAVAEAPHAKPKPLHAAPVKEKKSSGGGLWWLGLATLGFLLLTAVIVYLWRKRKEKGGDKPPSKYWVLLRKPFRRPPVPVLTETVDEVTEGADEAPAETEPSPFSR